MANVAEQLIKALQAAGVQRIYGIVGDSLNPVVDEVRKTGGSARGGIDWVHVRHEEGAAFAASAEAQVTGTLAVCAGSCGPGNLHLINGLYDAHRAGAPVLAIASQIPSVEIGSQFFQETNPKQIFSGCSGYNETVYNGSQAPRVIASGIRSALNGGGVSVITIPGDVAEAECGSIQPPFVEKSAITPSPESLQSLAHAINKTDKVAIFAGFGARDAHDELVALADKIGAPVGHSLRGKESVQANNPFDVGMSGLLGYGAAYAGMHDADLLILIGTDFPYTQFLPDIPTAQIDRDPLKIGNRTAVDFPVHADSKTALTLLLDMVERKTNRDFVNKWLKKNEKQMNSVVGAYTKDAAHLQPIHPEYAASILDDLADDDAVITTDTGMCNVWTARYINATGQRRFLASMQHGSMANALPHAIGAQMACPGRQVISISGDGGLSMLLSEMITVAMYRLPIKIVLFDNSTLGMVKAEMLVDGIPDFGVDVPSVDYTGVAQALGFHAQRVEDPKNIEAALHSALGSHGPALVQLITDPNALSMPPDITADQLKGFAAAMSKIVLTGGVGEAVKMAKSNIRNIPRP